MKFSLIALSLIVCIASTSCEEKKYAKYQCPMKCEKDKTYDKPGKCPVCDMDLEGVQ